MSKMTLDAAIIHAKELSESQLVCKDCREEHKQLAGWLEEETCTNESEYDSMDYFKCSNCGIELGEYRQFEIDEDYGDRYGHQYRPKYCPNCGSKIID